MTGLVPGRKLEEPEVPGEPVAAAVMPVVLQRRPAGPEALAALGPCSLAVVVLVVHNERIELMSRRWLSLICFGAEEACSILCPSR